MAANDSLDENLNKRTKELVDKKVEKGQGLQVSQEAVNQLQSLQDAQRSNLNQARTELSGRQQTNDVLNQAGQIVDEVTSDSDSQQQGPQLNPATQQILSKYGYGQPKVQNSQSRDVQVKPNNITVNNYYNTTQTNNVGPLPGRGISMKSPQPSQPNSAGTVKFKSWLGGVLANQQEQSRKRSIIYDRQEENLSKSGNDMLKKIESAGQDIIHNMSPTVIGTTLRSQLQMLLFLFAGTFLAKHFRGFMDIFTKIHDGVKKTLSWFGIGDEGRKLKAAGKGIQADIIAFFGGDPRKDTMGSVFKDLMNEAVSYFHKKLKYMMEERSIAIKNIQFPAIDMGDITNAITSIGGYLSDILAAIMDPKSGLKNSLSHSIGTTGLANSLNANGHGRYTDQLDTFSDNTSYGEAYLTGLKNGHRSYYLARDAVHGNDLRGDAYSTVSQSMDLIGALDDARSRGKIDVARVAAGFERLNKVAESSGYVIVDKEFLTRYYGPGRTASDILNRRIVPVIYKFVRVAKTQADFENEGAGGFVSGVMKASVAQSAVGHFTNDSMLAKMYAVSNMRENAKYGNNIATYALPSETLRSIGTGIDSWANRLTADEYTLKMVPLSDRRPGVRRGGKLLAVMYYKVPKSLLIQIEHAAFGRQGVDSSNASSLNAIRNRIIKSGGGYQAMQTRWEGSDHNDKEQQESVDITKFTQGMTDLNNKILSDSDDLADETRHWNAAWNNTPGVINGAIGQVNGAIRGVVGAVNTAGFTNIHINGPELPGSGSSDKSVRAKRFIDWAHNWEGGFNGGQLKRDKGGYTRWGIAEKGEWPVYAKKHGLDPTVQGLMNASAEQLYEATVDNVARSGFFRVNDESNAYLMAQMTFGGYNGPNKVARALGVGSWQNLPEWFNSQPDQKKAFDTVKALYAEHLSHNTYANGLLRRWAGIQYGGRLILQPGTKSIQTVDSMTKGVSEYGSDYLSSSGSTSTGGSGYVGGTDSAALVNSTGVEQPDSSYSSSGGSVSVSGGVGINIKAPQIPYLKQKSPAEIKKEQEENALRGEAQKVWNSSDWVKDQYKKAGAGYEQFRNWYMKQNKNQRDSYSKGARAYDLAKKYYDLYGKTSDDFKYVYGGNDESGYRQLASTLLGAPESEWPNIVNSIRYNAEYEKSVKSKMTNMQTVKDHDYLFKSDLTFTSHWGPNNSVEKIDNMYSGNLFDNGEDDDDEIHRKESAWYNLVAQGQLGEADKIIAGIRNKRKTNGYFDETLLKSGYTKEQQKEIEADENLKIGLAKSQIMFGDLFGKLNDKLAEITDQFAQLSEEDQAGDKGRQLSYQRGMLVSQMSSLANGVQSLDPNWSASKKRSMMEVNYKIADLNSQQAALEYQKAHIVDEGLDKLNSGELEKYQGFNDSLTDAAVKYSKERSLEIEGQLVDINKKRAELSKDVKKVRDAQEDYVKFHAWAEKGVNLPEDDLLNMKLSEIYNKFGSSGIAAYINAYNKQVGEGRAILWKHGNDETKLTPDERAKIDKLRHRFGDSLDYYNGYSAGQYKASKGKIEKATKKNQELVNEYGEKTGKKGEIVTRRSGEYYEAWIKRINTLKQNGEISSEVAQNSINQANADYNKALSTQFWKDDVAKGGKVSGILKEDTVLTDIHGKTIYDGNGKARRAHKGETIVYDSSGGIHTYKNGKLVATINTAESKKNAMIALYGAQAKLEGTTPEVIQRKMNQAKQEMQIWKDNIAKLGYTSKDSDIALAAAAAHLANGVVNVTISGTISDENAMVDKQVSEENSKKFGNTYDPFWWLKNLPKPPAGGTGGKEKPADILKDWQQSGWGYYVQPQPQNKSGKE